ncbi:MAG: ABC transporter ATP-binding protein [Bacteroidetes bacterium]|nr:ABC transporter ATP-binding protein [Bacteroidota bacterium]
MGAENTSKKNVWLNIYRLVKPYKGKLFSVFLISLLATAVTLFQPLIYREAINDISGLFAKQAIDDAKGVTDDNAETDEAPGIALFDKFAGKKETTATLSDSIIYTSDTIHYLKDTVIIKTLKEGVHGGHHRRKIVTLKQKEKIPETKIIKEPHTTTHVAPRTPNQAFHTLMWAVILLFIINILGLLFWWIGENMNIKLSCAIERNFILRTFGHVLKLPLAFFAKRSSSALHKQIDQSEEISGTVTYFTKDIFPEIVNLVGIIAIMFWQNHTLALLALSIVPFYLWLTIRSTKKLEMSLSGYYEKWEDVSSKMQDALAGIKTVKLSGAEQREVDRLDEQTKAAYKDYMKRSFLSHKYTFWQILLTHLATALVLSYGGYLALNHRLTPGDVVMFVAYLDMLYTPIDNLAEIWATVQQNITSVARAFKLLDTEVAEQKGTELQLQHGKIEFNNVQFGYNPDRQVLNGLSFTAEPGKVTALVGTSGAGKTTTVDLILKLFEPQQGEILIDGQKLSLLDESSIRRNVGMVSADGAIFRGTLADNIRYKKPDASDAEVEAAAIAAGMQNTLQRLPDGLNTLVGESGFGLSVGERQRVQIARVIVDKPRILIMDEATANLDYATEAEVKKTIDEIRKENTVVVIAHRFSMVKDADQVIVLDAGQVIEAGTPAALIEQGGWFANFANAGEEEEEEEEELEEEETDESAEEEEENDEEENEEEDA